MAIVSSTYTQDAHEQPGGAKWTIEVHTDHLGKTYQVGPYLAQPGLDVQATMTARAAQIEAQLAEAEAQEWLNGA